MGGQFVTRWWRPLPSGDYFNLSVAVRQAGGGILLAEGVAGSQVRTMLWHGLVRSYLQWIQTLPWEWKPWVGSAGRGDTSALVCVTLPPVQRGATFSGYRPRPGNGSPGWGQPGAATSQH